MLMTGDSSTEITLLVKQNIRLARKAAGLSQGGLADLLGVSRRVVVRWENGTTVRPREDNLQTLANALGKDLLWFYREHEDGSET